MVIRITAEAPSGDGKGRSGQGACDPSGAVPGFKDGRGRGGVMEDALLSAVSGTMGQNKP